VNVVELFVGVVRATRDRKCKRYWAAKEFTMTDDYSPYPDGDFPGPDWSWGLLELGWLADALLTFVGDSRGRAELKVLGAAVASYRDELRHAVATGVKPKVAAETLKHSFGDVKEAVQALMKFKVAREVEVTQVDISELGEYRSSPARVEEVEDDSDFTMAAWGAVEWLPGTKEIGFDALTDAVWELRQSTASKMQELSAAVELNAKRIEETLTLIE
jgi:hypothetical protein